MKVLGFNGSPNKKGNTACSLNIIFEELENAGIETEMIQVGKKKIQGKEQFPAPEPVAKVMTNFIR